jgi:hypothetical protein
MEKKSKDGLLEQTNSNRRNLPQRFKNNAENASQPLEAETAIASLALSLPHTRSYDRAGPKTSEWHHIFVHSSISIQLPLSYYDPESLSLISFSLQASCSRSHKQPYPLLSYLNLNPQTIGLHTTLATSLILDPLSLFVLFSLQDPQSSRSFTAGRFIYL